MINLPSYLKAVPLQGDEPPRCKNYGYVLEGNFNLFLRYFPIPSEYANPLDEKETIKIIHKQLGDDQGLIEVEKGETKQGLKFISVITKTFMGPQYGVQYFLRVNLFKDLVPEWSHEINAFFGEEGITGQRDTFVMAMLKMPKDWMEDPYDKTYNKGIRMNKSEDRKYDSQFPNHPLSQARQFLDFLKENN